MVLVDHQTLESGLLGVLELVQVPLEQVGGLVGVEVAIREC